MDTTRLKAGTHVEVAVLLYNTPEGPIYRWTAGYEFLRLQTYPAVGTLVVVKDCRPGLFQGAEYNYRAEHVRSIAEGV